MCVYVRFPCALCIARLAKMHSAHTGDKECCLQEVGAARNLDGVGTGDCLHQQLLVDLHGNDTHSIEAFAHGCGSRKLLHKPLLQAFADLGIAGQTP